MTTGEITALLSAATAVAAATWRPLFEAGKVLLGQRDSSAKLRAELDDSLFKRSDQVIKAQDVRIASLESDRQKRDDTILDQAQKLREHEWRLKTLEREAEQCRRDRELLRAQIASR